MGTSFTGTRLQSITTAFSALREEESSLSEQVRDLQKQLDIIRMAMKAMAPLVPTSPLPQLTAVDELEEEEEEEEDALGLFAGMKFSRALEKYLSDKPPMTSTEIAKGFEEAGWRFKSKEQSAKVNQVGVTLRRFRDKVFEQSEGNKWGTII